ncbi:tetratricopeptide repeat-containing protein [Desulfovibrio mangrovi]|uniref:tetratricopeptide repeat-containing protein n=1 Tax=Desulfovibrio mangrovi TaxID=2976983 RepID=UPI0022453762|nr:tetratricopeptide repeat-containing protein [Desulfovibrio mangrovi]UZP68272.1 tetratricopeptide repeat-containing protein [Desulfovibrio mangrovi]
MKAKIKWYQEVLELEPSSKVFFPLARLFAENDQYAEAVATLKQGLERHPEHFEARMLLIDCLGRLGANDKLAAEIASVGEVLSKYPSFWKNWAAEQAATPDGRDAALALSFLSATFSNTDISWSAIIEQGLRSVMRGDYAAPAAQVATAPSSVSQVIEEIDEDVEDAPAVIEEVEEPVLRSHAQFTEAETVAYMGLARESDSFDDGEEHEDEPFSLRTLTMAHVLAEQGDIKGALDICDELDASAQTDTERRRVNDFRNSLTSTDKSSVQVSQTKEDAQPLQGKTKLINTLEMLAERLEARAAR